jgi:hypothetical protein
MEITARYGIIIDGKIIPYGTNNVKKARLAAKGWNGKVVDLAAIGRKTEKSGVHVDYTYRKTPTQKIFSLETEKSFKDAERFKTQLENKGLKVTSLPYGLNGVKIRGE